MRVRVSVTKAEVLVDLGDVLADRPAIIGPEEGLGPWVVYAPGSVPVYCPDFESAVTALRFALGRGLRR